MADVLSPNTTISRYPAGDVVYVRRAYFYMFKSAYADCIGSFIGLLPYIPANRMQPGRIITEYEVLSNCYQIGSLEPSSPLV